MEGSVGDRQAGDSDWLASQRFQAILEVEVPSRQTTPARGYPPTDCSHGAGESDLGRGASGRGVVRETSDLGLPANGSVLLAVAVVPPRAKRTSSQHWRT